MTGLLAVLALALAAQLPPLQQSPKPPPLELRSEAGKQRAKQGGYCVTTQDPAIDPRPGLCVDTIFPAPDRLSVVRPGERVRLVLQGATGFTVSVHRPGCRSRALRSFRVGASGRWRLTLAPGRYVLFVFVTRFRTETVAGDSSGGLGVRVSRTQRRAVVRARPVAAQPGC